MLENSQENIVKMKGLSKYNILLKDGTVNLFMYGVTFMYSYIQNSQWFSKTLLPQGAFFKNNVEKLPHCLSCSPAFTQSFYINFIVIIRKRII